MPEQFEPNKYNEKSWKELDEMISSDPDIISRYFKAVVRHCAAGKISISSACGMIAETATFSFVRQTKQLRDIVLYAGLQDVSGTDPIAKWYLLAMWIEDLPYTLSKAS